MLCVIFVKFLNKINLKRYLLGSVLTTGVALAFSQNSTEVIAILVIYLATILNQFLLVEVIMELVTERASNLSRTYRVNKIKVALLFVLKLLILFGALSLGIHLMGKRVLIPLLNYVVLIFVLGLNLKDAE
ncbi:MAG: hypothetical protein DRQ88_08705 [Epsilonproteobacteria bacterium]|nr:MAG: hypothetical protein DRQ89_07660 [Campylobacterota bacterium]RLA65717.1 MAG: hypothetical protein DRQ88_08705 [Campylobacterota bacterium]